ncbi:AAA family ATPase [Phycicoccus sp. BSK3Z-2]|uniref:AAA family ATPase n=1 Tax=Phycicoccus avicenniae TaxID=2828860 RepID=A0A941HZR0_9MICO|nr:AAA family ATPase [Phycicoccus avicenniae]MBR7743135.1 AAA family ATPase [Phycicoccus avicenniae]
MEVQGFRAVDSLRLDFNSPITAFSGLNGTGKSTLAQLSACAYRKPTTAAVRRYYVKDFFPVSAADPGPFTTDAKIACAYEVQGAALEPQKVTVIRASKEWSGYKRQPERACYALGFTQFIPQVERRDFSIYGGHLITLGAARDLDEPVSEIIVGILSLPYEKLGFIEVTHSARTAELATATRSGRSYSENHMGFGEGRVVYIVTAMETAPAQSLFILEEPETSLHGDAQERLGRYLVDVAARRGHQILMTTHSAAILGQLSTDSIAYLRRRPVDGQVEVTPGLATYQVDAYLRGDRAPGSRALCTEDSFARQFVTAIMRKCDRDMIAGIRFVEAGGHDQVRQSVRILQEGGLKAVGITDGDCNDIGQHGVQSLPGGQPPEKVVFNDDAVLRHFANKHSLDVRAHLAGVGDHHKYAETLARRLGLDAAVVATFAWDAYVTARPASDFDSLLHFIRSELA